MPRTTFPRWLSLWLTMMVATSLGGLGSGGLGNGDYAAEAVWAGEPAAEADQATATAPADSPLATTDTEDLPPPLTEYFGRQIAPTMTFHGAPWLTRKVREKEESAKEMLSALEVQPGQVVCDFGCGNGYHTIPLARMVGPSGRVLAVDVQPEMLRLLDAPMGEVIRERIELIAATPIDPRLPDGQLDLILLVDVYHELSYPEQVLSALRRALKPSGRLVLVEFRGEDLLVPIRPEHKMTKAQVLKELEPNGFRLVRQYDELPWQHLLFFEAAPAGGK